MSDTHDDIPANWRDDPLEYTAPVRSENFLRDRGHGDPGEARARFLRGRRRRSGEPSDRHRCALDVSELSDAEMAAIEAAEIPAHHRRSSDDLE